MEEEAVVRWYSSIMVTEGRTERATTRPPRFYLQKARPTVVALHFANR